MSGAEPGVFFGVGSGRCGTMVLANALHAEGGVACFHEGNVRVGDELRERALPHLTLQNLVAYQKPGEAAGLFAQARAGMRSVGGGARLVGDIAYNNAPFVRAIPEIFPDARLIYLYRDGREFVRSVYTDESPDPTPVGWLDGRPVSRAERYVALGRLRPNAGDPAADAWDAMTPVGKNAWLWAETNRLVLDGLGAWDASRVLRVRFEDFVRDAVGAYGRVRAFLGIDGPMAAGVRAALETRINTRARRVLPEWRRWTGAQRDEFERWAGPMMARLGYGASDSP